jgi:hypothetical protein
MLIEDLLAPLRYRLTIYTFMKIDKLIFISTVNDSFIHIQIYVFKIHACIYIYRLCYTYSYICVFKIHACIDIFNYWNRKYREHIYYIVPVISRRVCLVSIKFNTHILMTSYNGDNPILLENRNRAGPY